MVWHDDLYLGKNCIGTVNRLKYKITNRLPHPTTYLITLPTSSHAVLEMIPSTMLMQEKYPQEQLYIVGMGASRREGTELMCRIIQDVYDRRNDFNVEKFLKTAHIKE